MVAEFNTHTEVSPVEQIKNSIAARISEPDEFDTPATELALSHLRGLQAEIASLEPPSFRPVAPVISFKGNHPGGHGNLVTPKQLVAIRAICNSSMMNAEAECFEVFGCIPEALNRRAASALIDYVRAKACEYTSLFYESEPRA